MAEACLLSAGELPGASIGGKARGSLKIEATGVHGGLRVMGLLK